MQLSNKITYMKTLGQRVRERRKELKLTQKQIGKYAGVSAVSVTLWEKDETAPKGEKLFKLAKILQCSPEWLLYEQGDLDNPVEGLPAEPVRKVPFISWRQNTTNEWRETAAPVSENAFAVRMIGDSMVNPSGLPSIPEGSIVIADSEIKAVNGAIVVAKLDESEEITVKKLAIDGPHAYLIPLNPNYKSIEVNSNYRVIGVVKRVEMDL